MEELLVGGHRARPPVYVRDPDRAGESGPPAGGDWEALSGTATIGGMEGSGFGDLFGDPDDLQRRLGEFAEQMQGAQRLAWADNAIKLAVDLTVASINRVNIQGTTEQQAEQIRSVMAVVFPEAVTLVREAREGLQ
ncbi:MAG: hypothetical protein ACXVE9_06350 [Solirubrobacteraceae bacterium]